MSDSIGRYKKVYPRIWRHSGFCELKVGAQRLALYILSGPQSTRYGIGHFSVMTAADDLNVGVETLREHLRDVTATFGWLFDADAKVIYIPSFWRWNMPENPNVLAANLKDLNEIPQCALVEAFTQNLSTLPETFHQTFIEGCAKRLRGRSEKQKQKQETGSGTRTETGRAPRVAFNGKNQNQDLVKIAREALRYTRPDDLELCFDTFMMLWREKNKDDDCPRTAALEALNVAISEQRAAQ